MEGGRFGTCTKSGAENPVNHAFCSNCGFALGRVCPNCSTPEGGIEQVLLFLDGILSELPDTEHWFEADPLARQAVSGS